MVVLLLGCQKENDLKKNWGSTHIIRIDDISEIEIQKENGSYLISTQQERLSFMNVIKNGEYNHGQLDIRPSDYYVEVKLLNGDIIKFSLWLNEGEENIFIDHEDDGHYIIRDENDRSKIINIINKADIND